MTIVFLSSFRVWVECKVYESGQAADSFLVEGGGGSDDGGVDFESVHDWKGIQSLCSHFNSPEAEYLFTSGL